MISFNLILVVGLQIVPANIRSRINGGLLGLNALS